MSYYPEEYKELVSLSNLDDMDSYYSKREIEEFFNKVFEDNSALNEGLEKLEDLADKTMFELVTEGILIEKDAKQVIYKRYPFYDLKDKLTVKIIYLSIKYFYRDTVNTSYTIYENPDYIKIILTFK